MRYFSQQAILHNKYHFPPKISHFPPNQAITHNADLLLHKKIHYLHVNNPFCIILPHFCQNGPISAQNDVFLSLPATSPARPVRKLMLLSIPSHRWIHLKFSQIWENSGFCLKSLMFSWIFLKWIKSVWILMP